MLVVKLEIWPGGDVSRARDIGRLEIVNVSALAEVSDCEYTLFDGDEQIEGKVLGHQRRRGAWKLVARVLKAALIGMP